MSYITLRDRWCDTVLNAHAPPEEKSDDTRHSFYKELERVVGKFSKCRMKILLGDLNAKEWGEDIFKPTIGSTFPHRSIHNTLGLLLMRKHNHIDHMLIHKRRHSNIVYIQSCRGAECDTSGCRS
jgi:hypothetical protein